MIDYRMETFLAVCRNMNFSMAAKELGLTQPAVSQHIKYLENWCGEELFEYTKKKLYLTNAGKILLNAAITQKSDEQIMLQKIKQSRDELFECRFGATMTIGEFDIIKALPDMINSNPAINFHMTISNTDDLLKKLHNDEISFAIVEGYFPKEQYDYRICSTERFIAVCSSKNRLAKGHWLLKDLLSERVILREKGSGTREILENNLLAHNHVPEDFACQSEFNSIHAIIEMVRRNCGITFIYETAVREDIKSGSVCEITLDDFNVVHDFAFIWNKNSLFEKDYERMCQQLMSYKER